jgi:sugar O-acyltransferase (sialic acid O-acetyltransferase NeuD family)
MGNRIIIIGAGGHGKVTCDALLLQQKYRVVGFADAAVPAGTEILNGYKVITAQEPLQALKELADYFIVAIGKNDIRAKLFNELKTFMKPATVVHPSAVIGSEVTIGPGSVILANAVVNTGSIIGENAIINCRTVVDHDCKIGANVHLSIGTMAGSNSIVGDNYLSSIGENINSFSRIGS